MKKKSIILFTLIICSIVFGEAVLNENKNGFYPYPFITAQDFSKSDYTFSFDKEGMKIGIDRVDYLVTSRFSDKGGKWVVFDGSSLQPSDNGSYVAEFSSESWTISRKVELNANHIAVYDTVKNKTDKLIAVRFDNNITPVGECSPLSSVAGAYAAPFEENGPERPFVHVISGTTSIGMIARDDVYRNQMVTYGKDKIFGIKDDYFGLEANESYTIKWELYPCQTSNYYEFINRVRNVWGTDKAEIPHLFAFIFPHRTWAKNGKRLDQMNVDEIREWLDITKIDAMCFIVMSDEDPRPAFPIEAFGDNYINNSKLSREYWRPVVDNIRKAKPGVLVVPYTHFAIGTPNLKGHDNCRMILKGGKQKEFYNYLNIQRYFFYPTPTNSFGKLMDDMYNMIQNEWGKEMYLDESSFGNRSIYMYGVPDWDGHSVEVNLTTNEPIQKVTNVALITRDYRDKVIDNMIACNWLPTTERDTKRMIPSFIEHLHAGTASRAHVSTPIVTAGQSPKNNADVAKLAHDSLLQGLLYFHIGNGAYAETTPSLLGHFYPMNVKEIWPGIIIGREKIITCQNGFYGFNDQSDMDVFIYDSAGVIKNEKGKPVIKNNKKYIDIQLNSGEIAIIKK